MSVAHPIKIEQPRITEALPRTHLFERLDDLRRRPLIWVAGPSGAGKTTLLSTYIAARTLPCLWYRVDASDQDPASLFHFLRLAAQKATPDRAVALPHFTSEYHLGITDFSRYYFRELSAQLIPRSCLLFDNCHEVEDNCKFFHAILAGLPQLPTGTTLVFISRREPPPLFSHHSLSGEMGRLGWDDLRLSSEEFLALAGQYGLTLEESRVRDLHALLDGWVAGLQLLGRTGGTGGAAPVSSNQLEERSRELIFAYFAAEVFESLAPECQEVLLKTSILPYFDAELAAATGGTPETSAVLGRICRANIFVHRHGESETVYRYHTLFRQFLLERCHRKLPRKTVNALYRSGAAELLRRGQTEEAAALFIESRHWHRLAALILAEAPRLLAQGRFLTLAHWLDQLPERQRKGQPWLLYWQAMCLMLQQPRKARRLFEDALAAFEEQNDISGIYLTMCGMGESLVYGFDSFYPYDRWLPKLEELTNRFAIPAVEIEARLTAIVLSAFTMRMPAHPRIDVWLERAREMLEQGQVETPSLRIQLLNPLILYTIFTGNLSEATLLLESFKAIAEQPGMPPLSLLLLRNVEALYFWRSGQARKCREAVEVARALARLTGIRIFGPLLLSNGASGAFSAGDLTAARGYLAELEKAYDRSGAYIRQIYHILKAWHDLLDPAPSKALAHARKAQHYSRKAGNPEAAAAAAMVLALALQQAGKIEGARHSLDKALAMSRDNRCRQIEFGCRMFLAEWFLEAGRQEEGLQALGQALALGREHGYICFPLWRAEAVAGLCTLALEHGIETGYVSQLIKRRGLRPDNPPVTLKSWPWPLRLYCLGRFSLVRDGRAVATGGKTQQKPLTLLKLLLAKGGRNVAVTALTDTLWPDADGDMQLQTFTTTLHRLRRLLGGNQAIRLQAGEVTLDNGSCWVDAWAFERLAQESGLLPAGEKYEETSVDLAAEAVSLYHGPFLASEDAAWAIARRELLHDKFVRLVEALASHCLRAADRSGAIAWYRRGLEAAPLVEDFYHQLMLCYRDSGRPAEALHLYERYARTLAAALGLGPSERLEQLRRSIRQAN